MSPTTTRPAFPDPLDRDRAWLARLGLALALILLPAGCGAPQLFEGTPVGEVPESELESSLAEELQSAAEEDAAAPEAATTEAADPLTGAEDETAEGASPDEPAADAGASDAAEEDAAGDDAGADDAGADDAGADDDLAGAEDATAVGDETGAGASDDASEDEPAAAPDASGLIGRSASGGELGAAYRLVDLRAGRHEGFTRFVWELASDGGETPYFEAVEERTEDGGARIRVSISDLYGYDYVGSLSAEADFGGAATGLRPMSTGDDAMMRFAVELSRPARFAIVTYTEPLRLVLDVYDD